MPDLQIVSIHRQNSPEMAADVSLRIKKEICRQTHSSYPLPVFDKNAVYTVEALPYKPEWGRDVILQIGRYLQLRPQMGIAGPCGLRPAASRGQIPLTDPFRVDHGQKSCVESSYVESECDQEGRLAGLSTSHSATNTLRSDVQRLRAGLTVGNIQRRLYGS